MSDVTAHTAIVTGGGTGIGRAIALRFAAAGTNVVVVGRRPDRLQAVAEEIESSGGRAAVQVANVRVRAEVDEMIDTVIGRYGPIDVLVNNAGGQFLANILDLTENGWKSVIDLNLNGTFNCLQAVGRHMVDHGRGSVINIITAASLGATPGRAHSGAARSAVANLTRSAALEWASFGVRVNALAPGPVLTEGLRDEVQPERLAELSASVPLGRLGSPDEIADAAFYLASPAAAFITGQVLVVDGGFSLLGAHDYHVQSSKGGE